MTRAFPGQIDHMVDFLEKDIIAVHWGISDLTGCKTKDEVARVVENANLEARDASLKVGLLFRFTNTMKVGDYCIVPYDDVFYIAKIKSAYYFDSNSVTFEHQRKVEWLFEGEPFGREELPYQIQISLRSRLGLTDMSKHESLFEKYLSQKQNGEDFDDSDKELITDEMDTLRIAAMKIIKNEIVSDDPDRRLQAAIAVMELNYKRQALK